MPLTRAEVAAFEADSDRVWPAREVAEGPGWQARWADGMHRRINSATVFPDADLPTAVNAIEEFYREHGFPPTVKITAEASHPAIDEYLDERGYRREAFTQVRSRAVTPMPASPGVSFLSDSAAWVESFAGVSGYEASDGVRLRQVIERMTESWLAAVTAGGVVAAVGLGSPASARMGIFAMATRPEHRGKGYASAILGTLVGRAAGRGLGDAFLQVMDDNATATRLYERLGFAIRYRYWYRVGVTPASR
jgi:GNAT superfamily N-acetyltransferase